MHDLKYSHSIASAVKKTIGSKKVKQVVVNVRLSPLSHVRPEGLAETFKQVAESEGLSGVELSILPLEFSIKCRGCGLVSQHAQPVLNCPKCKSTDFDIDGFDEFLIDSVSF